MSVHWSDQLPGRKHMTEGQSIDLNRSRVVHDAFRPKCKVCGRKIRGDNHTEGSHHKAKARG